MFHSAAIMAPPSTPDKYPPKNMFDTIVDIIVEEGANAKTFKLHKGILCFYSAYFDKALNGNFEEARKGVVKLPTEEVETFEHFVLWLYSRKIEDDIAIDSFLPLCKLWSFADRREIPLLMNTCIDTIKKDVVSTWMVPGGTLRFIYDNTMRGSGLRRFVIHVIGLTCGPEEAMKDENRSNWPADALWDLAKLTWGRDNREKLDQKGVGEIDTCQFHQHEEGVTCSKKRKRDEK